MKLEELVQRKNEPLSKVATDYFLNGNGLTPDIFVIVKLKALGWEQYGTGAYSNVYANPKKNYVLKLNKTSDEGYENYVELIKQHPNPHFPKISAVKTLNVNNERYPCNLSLYLIEKLYKVPYAKTTYYTASFYKVTTDYYKSLETLIEEDIRASSWSKQFNPTSIELLKENPLLVKALQLIGEFKKAGHGIDIHDNNYMQRKDGTIVITDPYVG